MEAPQHIIDYLKLREGWEDVVYTDSEGNTTAGMGHLLTATERSTYGEGDTVPAQVLAQWTKADTAGAYSAAREQAAEIGLASNTAFITVLTSVNYQLGTHWRGKFPQTWAAIRAGKWALAVQLVQGSKWAAQTPSRARDFMQVLAAQGQRKGQRTGSGRTALGIAVAGALALLVAALAAFSNTESN